MSDNGSIDKSIETLKKRYPFVRIIENRANLGFSKANNIGAQYAQGKVLFFLNPDTIILKGISEMTRYLLAHTEIGLIGPVILDQSLKDTTYFPTPVFVNLFVQTMDLIFTPIVRFYSSYQKHKFSAGIEHNIAWKVRFIHGCAMMMRKDTFYKISGFNDTLFMYGEEVDIGLKMKRHGYKVMIYSKCKVIHLGGRSIIESSQGNNEIIGAKSLKKLLKILFPYSWSIRYRIEMLSKLRQIVGSYINHKIMNILCNHDNKHYVNFKKHVNRLKALSYALHDNK